MAVDIRKELVDREIEERQRRIRLKWFEKHYEMLKANQEEEDDAAQILPLMAQLMNEVAKMRKERFQTEREVEAAKRKEREAKKQKQMAEEKLDLDPEILKRGPMYPVEQEVMDVLYKGISANHEGRWLYLKLRNKKAPDKKFYEQQTIQHDYGWKVDERALPANKQFARPSVIKPQFYRRTGVKGETLRNRAPDSGLIQMDILS